MIHNPTKRVGHNGKPVPLPLIQSVITAGISWLSLPINSGGTLGVGEIELKVGWTVWIPCQSYINENKADGFKYSQVASSAGRDLRFTDSTGGTLLAYQIDEWTPGGNSRLWVKIPEVKPAADGNTTITMWWGNENAVAEFPDYVSNGEVWSAYAARWSMDDPEGPSITDSSPNRNHGQKPKLPPARSVYWVLPSFSLKAGPMVLKSRHLPTSILDPVLPVPCG